MSNSKTKRRKAKKRTRGRRTQAAPDPIIVTSFDNYGGFQVYPSALHERCYWLVPGRTGGGECRAYPFYPDRR